MRAGIFIVLTLNGLVGSGFGLPPGSSDPCTNSPCGRGATCQTMSTIAVCTCPGGSSGDPFVDCGFISIPAETHTSQGSVAATASTHSVTFMPVLSNSGVPSMKTTAFSESSGSNNYNPDFQVGTNFNRVPIRGSSPDITSPSSSALNTHRPSIHDHANYDGGFNLSQSPPKFPLISQTRNPQPSVYPSRGNGEPDLTLNSFTKDPMGQYSNCRTVNNIIVCADNSVDDALPVTTSHQHSGNNDRFQEHIVSQPPKKYFGDQSPHQYQPQGQQYHNNHNRPTSENIENKQELQVPQPQRGNVNLQVGSENSLCKSMCGINSICRVFLGRPVCGCSEGHTGDPSVKCEVIVDESKSKSRCEKHVDCSSTEICLESKCIDPCNNSSLENKPPVININSHSVNPDMCGRNAKCQVVGHTPLCGCMNGFYGNPYVACVAS